MLIILILTILATIETLDIWFHGSITATPRARVDNWDGRLGELLRCRFCLTPWVALTCFVILVFGQSVTEATSWGILDAFLGRIIQSPVVALACAKAAGWLNADDVPKDDQLE
jgi:hypothetical protein